MDPEIRSAKPEEMGDFMHVVHMAYGLPPSFTVNIRPEWTLCAFMDDKLVTTYGAWPLSLLFAGAELPVVGITWVGTHPAYRRRNLLRKVVEAHFKVLYERRQQPIAILEASMAAIYQRYGYGVVSSRNSYSIEPHNLSFPLGSASSGSFREAGTADIELMLDLYYRFAAEKVGYLRRGENMEVVQGNPFTVLNAMPPASPAVKLIFEEAGHPQGYVIFSSIRDMGQGNPMGQRINVHDLVWLTPRAYRAIWSCLANLDLATRIEWSKAPPDDPLPHLLLEPRKLNLTSADGLLARIVDIEQALTLRPFMEQGELVFEVVDDLCPWNNGRWKFTSSVGGSVVKHTAEKPQTVMPVSTLAMLMFGQISPSSAARMGRLDVVEPDVLPLWDKVMRTPFRPFCADSF
jgi:predicted acetyltransferase